MQLCHISTPAWDQCKIAVRCRNRATTAVSELHDAGALFHTNLLQHAGAWAALFEGGSFADANPSAVAPAGEI